MTLFCGRKIWRVLLENAVIAILPAAIFLAFARRPTPRNVLQNYLEALVFSNCIGGLAQWILPRTWVSLDRLRAPWNWVARGAVLLLCAFVGSLAALG